MSRKLVFTSVIRALKRGEETASTCAISVLTVEAIGTIAMAKSMFSPNESCSPYDRPFLFACHSAKPPATLRLADPAPIRAASLSLSVLRFKFNALLAAMDMDEGGGRSRDLFLG